MNVLLICYFILPYCAIFISKIIIISGGILISSFVHLAMLDHVITFLNAVKNNLPGSNNIY